MAGLLSNLFEDGNQGGASGSESSYGAEAGGEPIDASPSVSVGADIGGSYEGADGSTHEWSSDNDVTLSTDVSATLGAAGMIDQQDETAG